MGKRVGVVFLIACLVLANLYFSNENNEIRKKVTAKASAVEGDTAPEGWVASPLYNFARINGSYGRLHKTVVYTPAAGSLTSEQDFTDHYSAKTLEYVKQKEPHRTSLNKGDQYPLSGEADPYWMQPYDFEHETIIYNGESYAYITTFDASDPQYDGYAGFFEVTGLGEKGCVAAVYNKIGGKTLGNLVNELNYNPSNDNVSSFHQDYDVKLYRRPDGQKNQVVYNFLKFGTSTNFYRLQNPSTLKGTPAADMPTGDVNPNAYVMQDDGYDFDALFSGEHTGVTVGSNTYLYKHSDYEPGDSDTDKFFLVEYIGVSVAEKINHDDDWFGEGTGWLFKDD